MAQFQGGMELCGLCEVCWFTSSVHVGESVLWCGMCKCIVAALGCDHLLNHTTHNGGQVIKVVPPANDIGKENQCTSYNQCTGGWSLIVWI